MAEAQNAFRELREHVDAVGPALGRQGCILASEERRATFLDDEDFESVVYGKEFDDPKYGPGTDWWRETTGS